MAVLGGDLAEAGDLEEAFGVAGEEGEEAANAVGLTAATQELLAEFDVGDVGGDLKAQAGRSRIKGGIGPEGAGQQGQALAEDSGGFGVLLIVKELDVGAQIRGFAVDGLNAEAAMADGNDVEAAVGIAFGDLLDGGSASDDGDAFAGGENDAKVGFRGEGMADHFLVALFEDMERQLIVGEQNHGQRKEGEQVVGHVTIMPL